MKKRLLFVLVLFVCACAAQGTLNLVTGPPASVQGIGGVWIGAAGNQPIYYFVVLRSNAGWVLPSNGVAVKNTAGASSLGGGNSVRLNWQAAPGATGYDVFRQTTPEFRGHCNDCVVALNTSVLTLVDTSPVLTGNYPPAGFFLAGSISGVGAIDQVSASKPFVGWSMLGQALRFAFYGPGYTIGHCAQFGTIGGIVALVDSGAVCGGSSGLTSIFGNVGPAITTLHVPTGDSLDSTGTGLVTANAIRAYTVATLPAGSAGAQAYVTDGLWPTDCAVGLGTMTVLCGYTGAAWVVESGGDGLVTFDSTAYGYQALHSNTTGYDNSAQGSGALFSNTTGNLNTAQGYGALYLNTTGYDNSAQGSLALFSNTTGYDNSAHGFAVLSSNTTGYDNSAQGSLALSSSTTGNNNNAQGYQAGYTGTPANANVSGSNNSWFGSNAGPGSPTQYNYQSVIGADATGTCSNCVVLGRAGGLDTVYAGDGGTNPLVVLALATTPVLSTSLPTCTATTGSPWRASVIDAVTPVVGVALTGGGGVFANVHCSLTTGTYIVDGI